MVDLSARVTRVRATNASPMTLTGTNSYVVTVGAGEAIVIDPGPVDAAHGAALVAAASRKECSIVAILVTHGHPDHFPGAAPLAAQTGAPVLAHSRARFSHDRMLRDRERLAFGETSIDVIDAPGHMYDHLVFLLNDERALFTGDVVVGSGTVVIAPPHGDMRVYQETLERLIHEHADAAAIYGGHGEAVGDPQRKLSDYIAHRHQRERQLLDALASGPTTIPALVTSLYCDVDERLWSAAGRQMLAYLIALERENRVRARTLERVATPQEQAILNPDLRAIVDPETARLAREELGLDEPIALVEYALT